MWNQIIESLRRSIILIQGAYKTGQWIRKIAYFVAVLFLAILVFMGWKNQETILPFLSHADYSQLIGFLALYFVSYFATVSGWLSIINMFNTQLDWWTHIQIYCITMATRLLPGTLWYVGGRMVLYQKLGISKTITLLANAIELIVLYIIASVAGLIFLFLSKSVLSITTLVILISSVLIAIIILRPRFFNWILDKLGVPQTTDISSKRIAISVFFYSINWFTGGLMLNQIVSVFTPGNLEQILYVIGAWMLSSTASLLTFFLPSSFGMKEFALTALLAPILPLPLAGAVAIIMRFFTFILEIAVSIAFYIVGLKSHRLAPILNKQQGLDGNLLS